MPPAAFWPPEAGPATDVQGACQRGITPLPHPLPPFITLRPQPHRKLYHHFHRWCAAGKWRGGDGYPPAQPPPVAWAGEGANFFLDPWIFAPLGFLSTRVNPRPVSNHPATGLGLNHGRQKTSLRGGGEDPARPGPVSSSGGDEFLSVNPVPCLLRLPVRFPQDAFANFSSTSSFFLLKFELMLIRFIPDYFSDCHLTP